jgi:hypothetical protein
MVRSPRTFIAIAVGLALNSAPAVAQYGSASLTHTVSVTVPPRVKVQMAALSTASATSIKTSDDARIQGLTLSVRATRDWVLSVGADSSPKSGASALGWSLGDADSFDNLSSTGAVVASGVISSSPAEARLFFRTESRGSSASGTDGDDQGVVLTITAP